MERATTSHNDVYRRLPVCARSYFGSDNLNALLTALLGSGANEELKQCGKGALEPSRDTSPEEQSRSIAHWIGSLQSETGSLWCLIFYHPPFYQIILYYIIF